MAEQQSNEHSSNEQPPKEHSSTEHSQEPVATSGSTPDRGRYGEGGYNAGMAVFSYIIGGILVWSLIGWGLDNLLGTHWIVLAGGLMGALGGFYLSHMHNLTRSSTADPGATPRDSGGKAGENPL